MELNSLIQSDGASTMPGWGNDFETEALPDALPQGMNSPQKVSYGLYAEQLSGFTICGSTVSATSGSRTRV